MDFFLIFLIFFLCVIILYLLFMLMPNFIAENQFFNPVLVLRVGADPQPKKPSRSSLIIFITVVKGNSFCYFVGLLIYFLYILVINCCFL